tara:strand:+ start:3052 stop:4764 length:1713 start_codon:yes stop_codon:yes gene_type:complete
MLSDFFLIKFIRNTFKELSPWNNIKLLHSNLKNDIIAGIMVAIIALPLGLAFGEISQLGPEAGIWSAVVGGIIGGLFGGSMVGVSGPTAPMASQIAVIMSSFVIGTTNQPDLVAAFSIIFLSGLILVGISILKISRFIHYIPYSVVAGFMCGIGVIIILSQFNPFVGLEAEKNIQDILKNIKGTITNINVEALYVSIPSLIIMFLWKTIKSKIQFLSVIPSPLAALIVGSSIAYFLNLNIPYIGDKMGVNNSSNVFTFYFPDLSRISEFIKPAIALAGLAVLDSLLSCKVADNLTGTRHSSDREAFGQGMANMAAGLVGGISTATATTQTVGNVTFGAKTPLSTMVKGLSLLGVLCGLGYLVAAIPNACLAAILFKIGLEILDYRVLPVLKKLPINDLLIFIIVFCITIYADLMIAVFIGVVFALFVSIKEMRLVLSTSCKHKIIPFLESDFILQEKDKMKLSKRCISVLQPHGPLFFGSTESLISVYAVAPKHNMLIIDMNYITMIDLSGIYILEDLIKKSETENIKVFVSNANAGVKKVLEKIGFIENIGQDNYQESEKIVSSIILDK